MILLLCIMAAAVVIAFFMRLAGGANGTEITVSVDGETFGRYSLLAYRTIDVENEFGHNRIIIKGGSAYMESADCPDKYCMTYKPISKTNENIICLPHHLVVCVAGAEGEIDAITQ
ncbi:MAG: NusG domain II-containing protein [Lachnospiraceae bacterium]|nr:NusG domain II-containing protein [Lachnospiraceae bacterium]